MDNIRVFLWLTLLGMGWLTYTAWNADYGAAPRTAVVDTTPATPQTGAATGDVPSLNPGSETVAQPPAVTAQPAVATGELIRVQTDVLDVRIASQGGDLVRADLLQYSVHKDMPEPVVRLLSDTGPERWVFQTGLH